MDSGQQKHLTFIPVLDRKGRLVKQTSLFTQTGCRNQQLLTGKHNLLHTFHNLATGIISLTSEEEETAAFSRPDSVEPGLLLMEIPPEAEQEDCVK